MKKGCNQCGKPLKDCGHKTLEELMTSKVDMREEISKILLKAWGGEPNAGYELIADTILALIKKHERGLYQKGRSDIMREIKVIWGNEAPWDNWEEKTRKMLAKLKEVEK